MKFAAFWFVTMALAGFGCTNQHGHPSAAFEWFNLSANEIWITKVSGISKEVSPGRLLPSQAETSLEVSALTFSETVKIADEITINWKDNGKSGWSGGPSVDDRALPGATHKKTFKREDLGLPATIERDTLRLTYLGEERWRIIILQK